MTNTSRQETTSSSSRASVVILNGFLGSGKTTLFRNLLAQSKKKSIRVCAIVNDMSDLDVDGELIATSEVVEENDSIMESIHSCVLSSKKGVQRLDKALKRLLANHNPELVIIETSGSCHPLPLVEYFKGHPRAKLTGVFALVDSLMLAHDYSYGEDLIPRMQYAMAQGTRGPVNLLVEQIMFCSHLVLTKSDRIEKEKVSHVASFLQAINPFVPVLTVVFGRLSIESLFKIEPYDYPKVDDLIEELRPTLEAEEDDDRPYDLATRVIEDDRPFHPQRLWDTCHQYLDQRIYRSKGFFWLASRSKYSLLWDQAAGSIGLEIIGFWRSGIVEDKSHKIPESEIRQLRKMLARESSRFGDRRCDLTVIGDKAHVDRFADALKSCFLTDDEIEFWRNGYQFPDPWPKNIVNVAK